MTKKHLKNQKQNKTKQGKKKVEREGEIRKRGRGRRDPSSSKNSSLTTRVFFPQSPLSA
jgi:hypothetical protein